MADDEVSKMINNLGDLNSVTFKAGLEFQGLTKRLITMSDTVSGAGRKWTIFARLVSGSPLWRLQNKVRAFVDSLALMEEASKKNTQAQKEADEKVVNLVKSNETMRKEFDIMAKKVEKTVKLRKQLNEGIIDEVKHTSELTKLMNPISKERKEAIRGTLSYSKAILLGKSNSEALAEGLVELNDKAKMVQKTFEETKIEAAIQESLNFENKTFMERISGLGKGIGVALSRSIDDVVESGNKFADFFLGTQGDRKREGVVEMPPLITRIGKRIDVISKIGAGVLKFHNFMRNFTKLAKGVLNYLFRTLIFVTMGILAFLVLAKMLHNAYQFFEEMGAIEDIVNIGFMLMDLAQVMYETGLALFSGDISTAIEKIGEMGMILFDMAKLAAVVLVKLGFSLLVSLFYTAFDLFEGLMNGDFNDILLTVGKFIVGAILVKLLAAFALNTLATLALPLAFIALFVAAIFAIIAKVKDSFKLPFMADGGVSDGGLTVVGEKGAEIVNLPKGSRVHSNADSKKMLAGSQTNNSSVFNNTVNVTINAKDTSDAELRRIADRLGNMITNKIQRGISSSGFVR